MDNKHKILLVLASLFIFLVIFRIMNPYRQKTVEELTYTSSMTETNKKKLPGISNNHADPEGFVNLEILKQPPPHSGMVYKNIFFDEPVINTTEPVLEQARKPSLIPEKTPMEQVKEELAGLKLFGIYEAEGKTSLFIEIDNQLLVVNKGDKIKGQYTVKEITRDSISLRAKHIKEILHIDFNGFVQ
jgi:Tfp pilus assembly protein PilP